MTTKNGKSTDEVPDYMLPTYQMIMCAYPDEIPKSDYYSLLYILQDSGMSYRSVAHAICLVVGGTIAEYSYEVGHVVTNIRLKPSDIDRVRNKLKQCGYDEWIKNE